MENDMLKAFAVSFRQTWDASLPWGNGHTLETDPTKRGWRLRAMSGQLAVIGRTGVPGCLSVVPFDGQYDVAHYDELTPEEAWKRLKAGSIVADAYQRVGNHSGWALSLIQEIEAIEAD